jgi:O-antigen ligase
LACFGGPVIGGFRLTGWVFVVMLAAAPFVFVLDRTPAKFPILLWLPWMTVVLLSLTWVEEIGRWQLQDAFQIVTPFFIAPIASKAIKNEKHAAALLRGYTHCLLILLAATAMHLFTPTLVLVRPMALTVALVGCVFVAQVRRRPAFAIAGWLVCLLITGITGARIATFALLMEWVLLPGFQGLRKRFAMGALVLVLAAALFYSPVFQERFFGESRGEISDVIDGNFNSTGRFESWPALFEEFTKRPWIGAGIGSSGSFVEEVWQYSNKVHNDYLRILLEQGVLGLGCFLAGVGFQLLSLRSGLIHGQDGRDEIRSAAILGFFVFLIVAFTDNPVVYGVWFMHPLFALAGASYPPATSNRADEQTPRSQE